MEDPTAIDSADAEAIRLYGGTSPESYSSGSAAGTEGSTATSEEPKRRRRRVNISSINGAGEFGSGDGDETAAPRRRRRASTKPLYASEEQISTLAYPIALTLETVFNVPARVRTAQWPLVNGRPAGEFWQLTEKEAMELASAWARVAAIYLPMEELGKYSALSAAVASTMAIVGGRIYEDQQMGAMFRAQTARQNASPPDVTGYAGGFE